MTPNLRQRVDGDIDAAIAALTDTDSAVHSDAANHALTDVLFESILIDLREGFGSQRLTAQEYADELAELTRQARTVGLSATA